MEALVVRYYRPVERLVAAAAVAEVELGLGAGVEAAAGVAVVAVAAVELQQLVPYTQAVAFVVAGRELGSA